MKHILECLYYTVHNIHKHTYKAHTVTVLPLTTNATILVIPIHPLPHSPFTPESGLIRGLDKGLIPAGLVSSQIIRSASPASLLPASTPRLSPLLITRVALGYNRRAVLRTAATVPLTMDPTPIGEGGHVKILSADLVFDIFVFDIYLFWDFNIIF